MTLDQLVGNMIDAGASKESIMEVIRAAMPPLTVRQRQNQRAYAKRKGAETAEIQRFSAGAESAEIKQVSAEIKQPSRVEDNLLTKKISGQKKEVTKQDAREGNFDAFWKLYPQKVGKGEAKRAFERALKRVSFPAMMAALQRYVGKTDDRKWCFPSTWLNQDRWEDQPADDPNDFFVQLEQLGDNGHGNGNLGTGSGGNVRLLHAGRSEEPEEDDFSVCFPAEGRGHKR